MSRFVDGVANGAIGDCLVVSAIEETWPADKPIVYLGQWCLRYSRRHVWSALDYTVAQYHWDDRAQIPTDLDYISGVYEALLPQLAQVLNEIHGVNYSVRYWRIVVGWWLFYFAQIFFDRWQVMQAADEAYPNARMLRMPAVPAVPASSDMTDFVGAMTGDAWNERLFADIAERWTGIQVDVAEYALDGSSDIDLTKLKHEAQISPKRGLFRRGGVVMSHDYLRRFAKIKLSLLLRQIPSKTQQRRLPNAPVDATSRTWVLKTGVEDTFAEALATIIPRYLPTCYLEGYAAASKLAEATGSVGDPQVIMTANAFSSDDRWKMWAAFNCERGSKLVIAQHGGHYGSGAWSASQRHEIAISDRYLSWGWRDSKQPKVYPAPATKLIGMRRHRPRRSGKCLQVVTSFPRQSYWMFSVPVGSQGQRYLDDQFTFAAALSLEVRADLIVRLYSSDYGWDQEQRWKEIEPDIATDSGDSELEILLNQTRLYVATYNATTFLESFTQGIPTVMFWNPEFWELSESAQPYFDALRQARVLFEDPVTCASHLNSIWNDVPTWWASSDVQRAVTEFRAQYAYVGPRPLRELKNALTSW